MKDFVAPNGFTFTFYFSSIKDSATCSVVAYSVLFTFYFSSIKVIDAKEYTADELYLHSTLVLLK